LAAARTDLKFPSRELRRDLRMITLQTSGEISSAIAAF